MIKDDGKTRRRHHYKMSLDLSLCPGPTRIWGSIQAWQVMDLKIWSKNQQEAEEGKSRLDWRVVICFFNGRNFSQSEKILFASAHCWFAHHTDHLLSRPFVSKHLQHLSHSVTEMRCSDRVWRSQIHVHDTDDDVSKAGLLTVVCGSRASNYFNWKSL